MNLKQINKNVFIAFSIIITILATVLISYLFSFFNKKPTHSELINNYSTIKYLIMLVFFAPAFETLIFQAAIIEFIIYHLKVKKTIYPVLISGLVFGSLHFFNNNNSIYMLAAILMGFVFASIYIIARNRKDINPIILTFICHFSVNFITFLPRLFS